MRDKPTAYAESVPDFCKRKFSGRDLLAIMDSRSVQIGVGGTKMIVADLENDHLQHPDLYRDFDYSPRKEDPLMSASKSLTRSILEHPEGHDWTLQGLGMLRTYLDPDHIYRLHVWSAADVAEGVSTLHTHPWDFESLVVAGEVHNTRYMPMSSVQPIEGPYQEWMQQTIRCGEGGGLVGEPQRIVLEEGTIEIYKGGDKYNQRAAEIHESSPKHGTVTLIKRTFQTDTEHAYVYFPMGEEWVTTEPRPATMDEVHRICGDALEAWFW